jgi:type IV secretion system protein VirB10
MNHRLPSSTLAFLLCFIAPGIVSGQSEAPQAKADPLADSRLVVPVHTVIPLTLKNAINSRTTFVGQAIYCETIYPITVGNRIIIPVGSYVKGSVTEVTKPGRVKGRAQIGVRFESITLPSGTTRPMRATLASYSGSGDEDFNREEGRIEGKSTKGKDAGTVATTATQGTVIGGLSSRSGTGAAVGALSGGVAGLVLVLATRGEHVVLPPGTNFELELSAPLSFDRDEVGGSSRYDDGPALPQSKGPALNY